MEMKSWTPVRRLECSVPVNADNFDSQSCGWDTAIDDVLQEGRSLCANLLAQKEECISSGHNFHNEGCICAVRKGQINILVSFLGYSGEEFEEQG